MVGSIRPLGLGWLVTAALLSPEFALGDDPKSPPDGSKTEQKGQGARFEDVPEPFVPLHPRTTEDRERLEALRLFTAARSMEDQRQWNEAIDLLEQALKKDPGSIAILRRLSRLNYALGRIDQAVNYSQKVIEADPGDTATLSLLVGHYLERKNDPAAAEALLKKILANPNLDKNSAGAVLAWRDLGDLYAEFLNQLDKAADAYEKVVQALDQRDANKISEADQRRILRGDEAESYLRFGEAFLRDKRYDDAILSFQRGLVYNPNHAQIPRFLAEALLKAGRGDEALQTLESYLRRQPQGREPYELLGEILTVLKRGDEFLPRLEAAAKADPKNVSLQFALAELYRKAGRDADADALLQDVLAKQGDPQVFGPLSASLLKEKKTEDLIKILGEAMGKRNVGGVEAVRPQIEAITNDPAYAEEVLDTGLKLFKADPPKLTNDARLVLAYIAGKTKKFDKLVALDRVVVERDPTPESYRELFTDLFRAGQYQEAGNAIREMIEKFPAEKDKAETYDALGRSRFFAGQIEEALDAARQAEKLDPNNTETLRLIGFLLGRLGRNEDAIAHYKQVLTKFANDEKVESWARSGLSAIYVNMEDYAKGEAELEILLAKDPDDPGVNNDLGYLYADQGKNLEKAEGMIRKALEEDPTNSAYLDSLGWVLFKRGMPKEALEPLEKAAKDTNVDATIFDHLGDVYFQLQQYEKAEQSWRKAETFASKSSPPDKRLSSIRKKLDELDRLKPPPETDSGTNP